MHVNITNSRSRIVSTAVTLLKTEGAFLVAAAEATTTEAETFLAELLQQQQKQQQQEQELS